MTDRRLNRKLTPEDATDIKTRIWFCEQQDKIAELYNVSQTTISRILHGDQHYRARWPNGDVGPLPLNRLRQIRSMRPTDLIRTKEENTDETPRSEVDPEIKAGDQSRNVASPSTDRSHDPGIHSVSGANVGPGALNHDDPELSEVERFRIDKEARSKALDVLAEGAEERMRAEMEAAVTAVGPPRSKTEANHKTTKPQYDLLSWDEIEAGASNVPLVMAARDSEDLSHCVRAAFKMLPRNLWATPTALRLVKDIAKSLDIDLSVKF